MAGKREKKSYVTTEEKIKAAARKVFMQKGYGASRTRDIAEEAGINLALLNYYFRSKEKLFHEIMMERVQHLFGAVAPIINDPSLSLESKMEKLASAYIDMLLENPDLPMFVLNELRKQPDLFKSQMNIEQLLKNSSFIKQLREKRSDVEPAQYLMNIMGLMLFPFLAKPVLLATGLAGEKNFGTLMNQRRQLIPKWIKAILQTK
ncbi:MAG: TetR/AcrR family transcriptional regulator [Bacteroidetes bacterium]|nr:TetR/AcrR family transcriptional regulator [Bacteroidota bacterium]